MKVICIDISLHINHDLFLLIEGGTYCVVGTDTHNGNEFYRIKEHLFTINGKSEAYYDKRHFIPLSDIDEMELVYETTYPSKSALENLRCGNIILNEALKHKQGNS